MNYTENIINYMNSIKGKVTYSMNGSRTGRDGTGDCSGTIYQGFVNGGGEVLRYPFSTETEHAYLLNHGYELIAENKDWNAKRGDIFIWGRKSASGGGDGHTGIFVDSQNIIHCNYGYNGVTVNNYDSIYNANHPSWVYVYRPKASGNPTPKPSTPTQQTSKWVTEKATFIANQRLPFSKDLDPNSQAIAYLEKGQSVKYDAYCVENGYVWIRQPRNGGGYYYLAIATGKNGVATSPHWGTIK